MILIAQIWLTVAVWRNGWGYRALWPGGAALVVGSVMGASEDVASLAPLLLIGDFFVIAVLAAMVQSQPGASLPTAAAEIDAARIRGASNSTTTATCESRG